MSNKIINKIKIIPGFLADVAKVAARFVGRKLRDRWTRFLDGRKPAAAFRERSAALLRTIRAWSFPRKALCVSFVILLICFGSLHRYCSTHFLPGTVINGADVSGMSLDEARSELTRSCESYELTIIEDGGKAEKLKGGDIGLNITFTKDFDNVLKLRSGYLWIAAVLKNESVTPGDTIAYSFDEALLQRSISELDCVNITAVKKPVDAELYYADGEFKIRDAISGNEVDRAALEARIKKAAEHQEKSIDLLSEGIYAMPAVRSDDPELLAKKAAFDDLIGIDISITIGTDTETLTPENVSKWCIVKSDGSYTIDEASIESYVDMLAAKYNTVSSPKLFVDHSGDTIEIGNSYYGWQLDNEYAAEALRGYLNAKKTISIDLTDRSEESNKWWYKTAAAYGELNYYGNTYAEVSIDSQYMWMYQNGEVAFESEVVTGLPDTEHDTPIGIYSILYKELNATLRGENYETEVAYWMVFTDDIGFHDADWQDAFGDDLYEYNGSHGCVNLPVEAAGELYDLVFPGMPVFVY